MNIFPLALFPKSMVIIFFGTLISGIFPQTALSQSTIHNFQIVGQKRIDLCEREKKERLVEYDSISPTHLILSDYGEEGQLLAKTRFLYLGEQFKLSEVSNYFEAKALIKDGIQRNFNNNEKYPAELIFRNDTLQQQITYYANGSRQLMFSGYEGFLNGAFVMWHPNGQLSFTGNYKNNLKEGNFESFDPTGKLVRKGSYHQGKLVSGQPVVPDLVSDKPEVPARYKKNDAIVNEMLEKETAHIPEVEKMAPLAMRILNLKFSVDTSGIITKYNFIEYHEPSDSNLIDPILKHGWLRFQPALVEGIPVRSEVRKSFLMTCQGLQITDFPVISNNDTAYCTPFSMEEYYSYNMNMPEFPGGERGLLKYLRKNIIFPPEALKMKVQGKVFIYFVVEKDGSIDHVTVSKGVHPLLNQEAVRVIKQMPKWVPGRQDGKPVRVSYTAPINFALQ